MGVNFLGDRIRNPYYQIIPGIAAVAISFVILLFVKQYIGFVLAIAVLGFCMLGDGINSLLHGEKSYE